MTDAPTTPTAFPDRRLQRRASLVRSRLRERPNVPLTQAMTSSAEVEGAYRLLENRRVKPPMLLAPALDELALRVGGRTVLAIHDSTAIRHATAVDADDTYELGLGVIGYLAHATLVVDDASGEVLGVGALSFVQRARKATGKASTDTAPRYGVKGRECLRWSEQALEADGRLRGMSADQVVHVMDREADMYEAMRELDEAGLKFVIRASHTSRLVDTEETRGAQVATTVTTATLAATREVPLSRRKKQAPKSAGAHPAREARMAKLEIRAMALSIRRPKYAPKDWPPGLAASVVHVVEVGAPEGVDPVSWVLWTNLPVDTPEAALRVVDAYRRRWLIEEMFKALKSGCQFEKKRFESAHPSQNALAVYLPIAAEILRLRNLARQDDDPLAAGLVDPVNLAVLREFVPHAKLPRSPTVRQVVMAIALLGGHLKQNGEPGWHVLARGYEDLLRLSQAWRRATAASTGAAGEM
jgi:hypothetical protein